MRRVENLWNWIMIFDEVEWVGIKWVIIRLEKRREVDIKMR